MTDKHPESNSNGLAAWRRLRWFVTTMGVAYKDLANELGVAADTIKGYVNGYKSHHFALKQQEKFSARWLDPHKFPGAKRFFTAPIADDKELEDLLYGRSSHSLETRVSLKAEDSRMWFLVARPAQDDDIDGILAIAEEENIASMTFDRTARSDDIRRSKETLAGERTWNSGLLFLVTKFFDESFPQGDVAGCSKITIGKGGFWTKKHRATSGGGRSARIEYLTFEVLSPNEKALEIGGNYVLKKYRNSIVDEDKEPEGAVFLFYEEVVSSLLGGLRYEEADRLRYEDELAIPRLLIDDENRPLPVQLPEHLIRSYGGLGAVRKQTERARAMWERRGFKNEKDRFDALDGGLILESKFTNFVSYFLNEKRELRAVRAKRGQLEGAKWYNFAPVHAEMKDFVCARARALIEGNNTFVLDESAFNELDLSNQARVWALVRDSDQTRPDRPASYSVGSFNADARVLFLMMYQNAIFQGMRGSLDFLFINLLTRKGLLQELTRAREKA